DPELVGRDVLVADDQLVLLVDQHDRGQLLHLEALWVVTIDSFPVGEDTRGVDRGGVDQGDWRHAQNILSDHQRNSVPARTWLDRRFAGSSVDSRVLSRNSAAGGVPVTAESGDPLTICCYHDYQPRLRQGVSRALLIVVANAKRSKGKHVSRRLLGTMITYGYKGLCLDAELDLAQRLGAEVLEILPDWRAFPDAGVVRQAVTDRGLSIHSAHGCWGGRAIKASRVDLSETDAAVYRESADDLKRCIDWLQEAGGTFLVVHPGGLSAAEARAARRACLARGLTELADHAEGSRVVVCVENMPPGVHPGSLMGELYELLGELDRPGLALALDTGHAHLSADLCAETAAAGSLLATTHVHDNDGQIG